MTRRFRVTRSRINWHIAPRNGGTPNYLRQRLRCQNLRDVRALDDVRSANVEECDNRFEYGTRQRREPNGEPLRRGGQEAASARFGTSGVRAQLGANPRTGDWTTAGNWIPETAPNQHALLQGRPSAGPLQAMDCRRAASRTCSPPGARSLSVIAPPVPLMPPSIP